MRFSDDTEVLEAGEYCEVCSGTTQLGRCELPGNLTLTVCVPCHDGPGLQQWLEAEMEAFLVESPDYELLPDGKFRRVNGGRQL